jgi:hypothetical protein
VVWTPERSLAGITAALSLAQEVRKKQRLSMDEEDGVRAAAGQAAAGSGPAAHASGAPPSSSARLVLVWDLDETLLLFNSLLVGTYQAATQRGGPAGELVALGRRWEAAILSLCDRHFFFDQVGCRCASSRVVL